MATQSFKVTLYIVIVERIYLTFPSLGRAEKALGGLRNHSSYGTSLSHLVARKIGHFRDELDSNDPEVVREAQVQRDALLDALGKGTDSGPEYGESHC